MTTTIVIRLILSVGFAIGTAFHIVDVATHGWLPYRAAPPAINAFWTSLTLFDPLAILLLWWRPRYGLILAHVIMIADVLINAYASIAIWHIPLVENGALLAQFLFLVFLAVTARFVWRRSVRS
ncbi:MAG: hypothetical protein AAF205_05155 [Pseudomonadota bacterium]